MGGFLLFAVRKIHWLYAFLRSVRKLYQYRYFHTVEIMVWRRLRWTFFSLRIGTFIRSAGSAWNLMKAPNCIIWGYFHLPVTRKWTALFIKSNFVLVFSERFFLFIFRLNDYHPKWKRAYPLLCETKYWKSFTYKAFFRTNVAELLLKQEILKFVSSNLFI